MALRPKHYRVSGYDEDGDLHAFETNDLERAKNMELVFRESLKDVELERRRGV
jgi:hypothetical protein